MVAHQNPAPEVPTKRSAISDSHKPLPDTSSWLTRNESTDLLHVSTQTLVNYEERGHLHPLRVPRRDSKGREQVVVVYDPKELANLPRGIGRPIATREPGETAARATELFREGKSNEEVVVELRETFDRVDELRSKWLDAGGSHFVISPIARAELEKVVGPFGSVAELVARVVAKLGTP